MITGPEHEIQLSFMHKNKSVKVTLTFPPQSDPKAAQDFFARLKELYLEKINAMAVPAENPPTPLPKTEEQGGCYLA